MRTQSSNLRRRVAAAGAAVTLMASFGAASVFAGGPPATAFYVDDVLYRTVGTPTDLSRTGAPAHTYDTIYELGGGLMNVAESKPGDRDYNGGRWMVLPVTWAAGVTPIQFTNDGQVLAAADAGLLTIAASPARQFVCPVIAITGSSGS
jgi:hypothetical protein